jgi:geranylgeranyl diphosphate synthase, type II
LSLYKMESNMCMELIKDEIESWLEEYFKEKGSYNRKIYDAMSYSLKVGGKRIRPILVGLSYRLYKLDYKEVLPVACALEMIHTYSLIHDDLPCMDDDDLRRGKPTSHKVFGEALAVLAGDGLLNEAMNIMFKYCLGRDGRSLQACRIISEASGVEGMIGGQVVDILSEGRQIDAEELSYMHSKKTGALIKAAILSGAALAGAPSSDLEVLERYGDNLGLAFQIKDDILDVTGSTEVLGKKINSDENNNKTTFVTTYGLESCKDMCVKLTDECIELLKSLKADTEAMEKLTLFLLKREF